MNELLHLEEFWNNSYQDLQKRNEIMKRWFDAWKATPDTFKEGDLMLKGYFPNFTSLKIFIGEILEKGLWLHQVIISKLHIVDSVKHIHGERFFDM